MTDILMNCLRYGLAAIIFPWLLLSPIVFCFWLFDFRAGDRFADAHPKLYLLICAGATIAFFLIVKRGISGLLFFITEEIGLLHHNHSLLASREPIAWWSSVILIFVAERTLRRLHALETDAHVQYQIHREVARLEDHDLAALLEQQEVIRSRLTVLRSRPDKQLSRADRQEIDICSGLLPQLERMVVRERERLTPGDEH